MSGTPPPPPRPLLERLGLSYLAARSAALPPGRTDGAAHVLDPAERENLVRVTRGGVLRAAIAGAVSAGIAAAVEVGAMPMLPPDGSLVTSGAIPYWVVLGAVTLAVTVIEIAFVYWDTLRSVHELARVSGVAAFHERGNDALALALARAALELPNPVRHDAGVNPHREASKWRLVAVSLAYKAKVGVTSFVVKLIVRRLLGRVALRGLVTAVVPFVAVPIAAMWNGIVTYRVLREARVRAMGPSAIHDALGAILRDAGTLSPEGRIALARAVASAIVRTEDLHPNLARLLDEICSRLDLSALAADVDDVGAFLRALAALPAEERRAALRVLALAIAIDGRVSGREAQLFREALVASGAKAEPRALERLRDAFAAGDGIAHDVLATVAA